MADSFTTQDNAVMEDQDKGTSTEGSVIIKSDDKASITRLLQSYCQSIVSKQVTDRWIRRLRKSLEKLSLQDYLRYVNNDETYALEEFRSDPTLPVGLENLGATCYVNVLIQALFQSHHFRKIIYSAVSKRYPEDVWSHLQNLFVHLQYSNRKWISPEPFIQSMSINIQIQQDSTEFFKTLLTKLQACINSNSELVKHLQDTFCGQCQYITCCLECGKMSRTQSLFYELDLYIRGKKSLIEALKFYSDWEHVSDAICSHCYKQVSVKRSIQISNLPPILTVQLLRFTFDEDKAKKIQSNFSFPLTIRAKRNSYGGYDFDASETDGDVTVEVVDDGIESDNENEYVYHLTAVLVHRGQSASSGHYIAYTFDATTDSWIKFDDKCVSKMTVPGNNQAAMNSSFMKCAKDAYLLMYSRSSILNGKMRNVDFDGIINKTDPDLSFLAGLRDSVQQENEQIASWKTQLQERKEELETELSAIKALKSRLLDFYTTSPLHFSEDSSIKWMRMEDFTSWMLFNRSGSSATLEEHPANETDSHQTQDDDVVEVTGSSLNKDRVSYSCPHDLCASFQDSNWIPVPDALLKDDNDESLSLTIDRSLFKTTSEFCPICLSDFLNQREKDEIVTARLTTFNSLKRGKKKNTDFYLIRSDWQNDYFKTEEIMESSSPYHATRWASADVVCPHGNLNPSLETIAVNGQTVEFLRSFTNLDTEKCPLVPCDLSICPDCCEDIENQIHLAKQSDDYVKMQMLFEEINRFSVREDYFCHPNEVVPDPTMLSSDLLTETFMILATSFVSDLEKYLKNPLSNASPFSEKSNSDSSVGLSSCHCEKHGNSLVELSQLLEWRQFRKFYILVKIPQEISSIFPSPQFLADVSSSNSKQQQYSLRSRGHQVRSSNSSSFNGDESRPRFIMQLMEPEILKLATIVKINVPLNQESSFSYNGINLDSESMIFHYPSVCEECSEQFARQILSSEKFVVIVRDQGVLAPPNSSNNNINSEEVWEEPVIEPAPVKKKTGKGKKKASSSPLASETSTTNPNSPVQTSVNNNSNNNSNGNNSIPFTMIEGRKSKRQRLMTTEFKVPFHYGDNLMSLQLRIMQVKGYPPLCQYLELLDQKCAFCSFNHHHHHNHHHHNQHQQNNNNNNPSSSSSICNNNSSSFVLDDEIKFKRLVRPNCIIGLKVYEQNFDEIN